LPKTADVAALCSEFPWLMRAAWWGVAKRTVLAPRGADFELHVVTEQKPVRQNRISLSETRCDALGQPLALIDWNVTANDVATFMAVSSKLIAEWEDHMPARIGMLDARVQPGIAKELTEGGGIYHPAGSTRMGTSRSNSVLDGDLALHGVNGLRVVSTSAFPSGGGANPSLMLLLFAMRSAAQIELELK
jgi:choline dehydrogenase-like flavoprotein